MDRVFVSRPERAEVVEADYEGKIMQRWHGKPTPLQVPQGLAVTRRSIYVADIGANRILALDRIHNRADVIAGNGKAEPPKEFYWQVPKACPLARPTGLIRDGGTLLISVAGLRQIWALEIQPNIIGRAAGSGNSGAQDGEFLFASFENPTGLALAAKGERVYIADAGRLRCMDFPLKSIRTVPLAAGEHVTSVTADRDRYLFTTDRSAREVKIWDTHGEHVIGRYALPWALDTASISWSKGELWALADNGRLLARKRADQDSFEVVALSD